METKPGPDVADPRDNPVHRPLGSPHGPVPLGPDLAAGGADSSPLDNLSSDERHEAARTGRGEPTEPREPRS